MKLFTSLCLICDANTTSSTLPLCNDCLHELPANLHTCEQCGLTLENTNSSRCGKCQTAPPAYDKTITPYVYNHAIKHLIIELKFKKKLINAYLLGKLLAQAAHKNTLPDFLLPVPLHKSRLRKRGFNQAMELCHVLSKELSIPILSQLITKTKATTPQSDLSAEQRKQNLHASFRLVKSPPTGSIAIIDDVITTGTTVNEITKLLKNSGTTQVQAWACARTL